MHGSYFTIEMYFIYSKETSVLKIYMEMFCKSFCYKNALQLFYYRNESQLWIKCKETFIHYNVTSVLKAYIKMYSKSFYYRKALQIVLP